MFHCFTLTNMASLKSELTELDRKLQELNVFYKNTPTKETITTIIDLFKGLDPSVPLKTSLRDTMVPSYLSSILDCKNTVIHINVFELVYLCIVNDLYSTVEVSRMIENLTKHSWSQQYKLKILQMCFYFVRMNLPVEIFFKLLSLVVESFVIEDSSMDLIARPIVSQIVEKILGQSNRNISDEEDYTNRLLQFIYTNIVYKKQYFLSYMFPVILKYPEINLFTGFSEFLSREFTEMALAVINNGRSDEKGPIFEAVLKIERSWQDISMDAFYNRISVDVTRCDFLLRFISFLIQIKSDTTNLPLNSINDTNKSTIVNKNLTDEDTNKNITIDHTMKNMTIDDTMKSTIINDNIKEILRRYFLEANFTGKTSEKYIRFFNQIVLNMKIEMDILFIIEIMFEKIACHKEEGSVATLYRNSLDFCIKNDLRDLFNKGLISGYKGNIKDVNEIMFDVKNYVKESWSIFFDFNSALNNDDFSVLDRISEFDHANLEYFINALPCKSHFSYLIFEKSKETLRNSIELFEVFLQKIENSKELFKIILEYNTQEDVADPRPLKVLIGQIETSSDVQKDSITNFLESLIDAVNLDACWDEFFQLLKFSDSQISILMKIIKNKISEKNVKFILETLKCLLDQKTNTVLLDAFKDYFEFILEIDPKNASFTDIWTESLIFISDKIDDSTIETSHVFLEILFKVLLLNYENADNVKTVFFNRIVFEKIYGIKDVNVLKRSLEELSVFLERFLPRYDLEELVLFLSSRICESCEDKMIPQLLFENIKIISRKIKAIINQRQALEIQEAEPKVILKYKGKKKKSQKTINFTNASLTDVKISNSSLMDQKVFQHSKTETQPLVSIIFQSFKTILSHFNVENSEIILQVFAEIPSFVFNSDEISDLSEHLRKYIEMAEPFRTSALECFIKTCGVSQQFSFCLMILSSWLSKESREISLSLIDKIKENLVDESHHQREESHKLAGLSYFLDYSLQFSQSDDFLEPVLDLVERCGCSLDREMVEKLVRFSKRFVLSQIEIKYNETREEKLSEYMEFLFKTVMANSPPVAIINKADKKSQLMTKDKSEDVIDMFIDTLVEISNKKTYYVRLKMKCFEILFDIYQHSETVLKSELKAIFNNLTDSFTKQGAGISEYSMAEARFILMLLIKSGNTELISSLKMELVGLLLIRDYSLIDLVSSLLKKMFL